MELSLANDFDNTKPWGDMLYEEQQTRKTAILRMSEPEWLACVNAYFNTLRGNGRSLISALAWASEVSELRAKVQSAVPVPAPQMTEAERNWRVWQDMVEEPWKYGSDIGEWLALDAEVRSGPKRWRVDAYWYSKVRELEEIAGTEAATKLQALWRGFTTRRELAPHFTCARCLCHRRCFTEWTEVDSYICPPCDAEWTTMMKVLGHELEQEEERALYDAELLLEADTVNEVCGDCGDDEAMYGSGIGEFWLCPSCLHDWEGCEGCGKAYLIGTECDNHCSWCGDSLEGLRATGGYCTRECATDAMRVDMKD